MWKDVESRNIPAYCVSAADASCADPCVIIIIIVIVVTVIILVAVAAAERTVSRQRRTLPAVPPAQSPHILRTGAPVHRQMNSTVTP